MGLFTNGSSVALEFQFSMLDRVGYISRRRQREGGEGKCGGEWMWSGEVAVFLIL